MKLRRRSLITREGWYYLFILGFVIVGSLLRHINLLVGLSAILSTAMIFNWRITRASLRQVRFARRPQPPVWCHQPTTFEVEVENQRSYLTSFSVMVSQSFRPKQVQTLDRKPPSLLNRLLKFFTGNAVSNYALLDAVNVGQTRTAEQLLEFRDRGEYEMGPLTISTHYPLGLTRREISDTRRCPLFVGPALGQLSYGWVDRMLGLGWQDASGGATSRSGDEFFSLRPWMNGDSRRWVHWRATARHGTVLVRQFQRSQSKAFSLIVDLSLLSTAGDSQFAEQLAAIEKMLRIVATISHSVKEGHADTARIFLVADQIHQISFPAKEEQWTLWHQTLATIQPSENPASFLNHLVNDWKEMGLSMESAHPPAVVLSLRDVDQFQQTVRHWESQSRSTESVSAPPEHFDGDAADAKGIDPDQQQVTGSVATATPPRSETKRDRSSFWEIQRLIRTWLTPGDSRLGSWYVDAPTWNADPTDLSVAEELD